MNPFHSLALLFVSAGLPSGDTGTPQAEETTLITYDLRAVMPRWDSGGWSMSLLVPPVSNPRQDAESLDGPPEYAELASFELHDLLTQVLGDELRREGREILVEGNVLTVLAPPGVHEQVSSVLESLKLALGGTVPIQVDVLDLAEGSGALPPAGTLASDEALRLIGALEAKGAQRRSYSLELSTGRTARLDAYRRIPFLFDYDVEVAQGMVVFGPVMGETREGTRLAMRGLGLPNGLALSMLFLRSELLGKIQKRSLTLNGLVNHPDGGTTKAITGPDGIQSPEVLVRGLAFDTYLPDGSALALTIEATLGKTKLRELVVIRRLGGAMSSYVARPIPRTNRTLIALDAELFRPGGLFTSVETRFDSQGMLSPRVVASLEAELSGFLMEWMKARFSVWRRFGPWILVVTDPAWDRDAAAQLDRLVKSLRPVDRVHDVVLDLHGASGEEHPVRLSLPLLEGSRAGLVVARGGTAVTGFDVEVAQGASVADPFVSSIFDGLALAFSIEGTTLEARGVSQLFDSPITTLDTGYDMYGPIERPEPRLLRFDERLEMPEGHPGPLRIGSGADPSGLALEVTVVAPRR